MKNLQRLFLYTQILIAISTAPSLRADEPALHRILFGSCIKQDRPVPIFETILKAKPQVFVFLGDNIYGDTEDMAVLKAKYAKLGANPGFRTLKESCRVLATWDDHDYGINDGGADYSKREESQRVFLDFWGATSASPLRSRPGIYDSFTFGPEGRRVQFILLDTRYFRSELKRGERRIGGPYYPDDNADKTMLGDAQWIWLRDQLEEPAEVRIVATSIQCIAESAGQETWSNLPRERERLFRLINETDANGILFISGDRHWSELAVTTEGLRYPLYELTSSSLNQPHQRGTPTVNRFRVDERTYHHENFGVIQVDWDKADPEITLEIRDIDGQVRINRRLALSSLRAPE